MSIGIFWSSHVNKMFSGVTVFIPSELCVRACVSACVIFILFFYFSLTLFCPVMPNTLHFIGSLRVSELAYMHVSPFWQFRHCILFVNQRHIRIAKLLKNLHFACVLFDLQVSIGYLPNRRVIGLSKLARYGTKFYYQINVTISFDRIYLS